MVRTNLGRLAVAALVAACGVTAARSSHARLRHARVDGVNIETLERVRRGHTATAVSWASLSTTKLDPGRYELAFSVAPAEVREGRFAVEIPPCGGRGKLHVDGVATELTQGPAIVPLDPRAPHALRLEIDVSEYERRIACGEPPRAGTVGWSSAGIATLELASPVAARGGGMAVVYVPRAVDAAHPAPLLVGVHPWNGSPWTYANYTELLTAAEREGVALLMPSGLGNSLYTEPAEDEVLRALDAALAALPVDRQRVSIWGASMGGQGATTIGLHNPDRFASITSYFGDARFDVTGYVRGILPTEAAAHAVNPVDVIDNARHVPIWLIHGDADKTSPVAESDALDRALSARGYFHRYDRVPGAGHEGALVARFVAEVVARAKTATTPRFPERVTLRSVRARDAEAYGVKIERSAAGDALVDVERRGGEVHLLAAENVRRVVLRRGALGGSGGERVVAKGPAAKVDVVWESP